MDAWPCMTMHDLQIEHVFSQLFAPITLILVKPSGLKHNEAAGSDGARGKAQIRTAAKINTGPVGHCGNKPD